MFCIGTTSDDRPNVLLDNSQELVPMCSAVSLRMRGTLVLILASTWIAAQRL